MSDLTLQQIPFTDGLPDEGQLPINWIVNGECLNGTENKRQIGGSLNRAPSQIQANINVLVSNQGEIKDKINVHDYKIEIIEDNLGVIGDQDLIKLVNSNFDDITDLKAQNVVLRTDTDELKIDSESMKEDIGHWHAEIDPVYRTVRDELEFQKDEMGNYPGFDKNGQESVNEPGKGMKGIIMDSVGELVNHRNRIRKLEDDWVNSDVGHIVGEVQELRKEMGPKTSAKPQKTVYVRLDTLENKIATNIEAIDEIKESIDFDNGSIAEEVSDLRNSQNITEIQLNAPKTGLSPRVEKLESTVGSPDSPGSVLHSIKLLDQSNRELKEIVGESNGDGLRYSVVHLNAVVGIVDQGQPLPVTSILHRLNVAEGTISTHTQAINDINSVLGGEIADHSAELEVITKILAGDPAATPGSVDNKGIVATVKAHEQTLKTTVTNAPIDGLSYVRRGDAWVQIPTAVGRYGLVGGTDVEITELDKDVMIPMDKLTADSFNRDLVVENSALSIIDKGAYKIEAKMIMKEEHAAEKFVVSIFVNGVRYQAEWIAFNNLDNEVVTTAMIMLNITANDRIELAIRCTEGDLGSKGIKQLGITAQPL